MKEMIKKYKGTLICSVLVMLAGILVGFTMAQSIWINVFFVVTDCILVTIIFYDNRNRQQSSKVIGMVIWIIPVTTLIYNGMESGLYGHCRMKKTGVQLIDSVENYGWHQVSYVCFAAFLEKALLLWFCIL